MRVSSDLSWPISFWMLAFASSFSEPPELAWTERSRMRCRIEVVSDSAPSAVCTTLVPSWVLRTAWVRPPICERRPSEMARPAASSAAELMRQPEDSRSSDLFSEFWVVLRLRYAFSAAMLVLTLRPTGFLLGIGSRGFPAASVLRVACTRDYGAEPPHLEAKVAKVRVTFPRSGRGLPQAGWAVAPRSGSSQFPREAGIGPAGTRPVTRSTYSRCWLRARTPPSAGTGRPSHTSL